MKNDQVNAAHLCGKKKRPDAAHIPQNDSDFPIKKFKKDQKASNSVVEKAPSMKRAFSGSSSDNTTSSTSLQGSVKEGSEPKNFFSWLLGVSEEEFFRQYFEKKHLFCSHGDPSYFHKGLHEVGIPPVQWSTAIMKDVVSKKKVNYGTDLNVVRFDKIEKRRISYKTEGPVTVEELQKCMSSGWSLRFLRPHEHVPCNGAFISMMEEQFHCYCGLNSYWTPANSQGFAPHYDDVDVFLLQMEGEKEWRLYDPLEKVGQLSRHSSEDYLPEQFPTPKHHFVLKAGDVLYMPRGMVHQGRTFPHTHSLHVTFSANQRNSWADLFLTATRYTIETLAANHVSWRKTIPRQLFSLLGAANSPAFRNEAGVGASLLPSPTALECQRREKLQQKLRQLAGEVSLLLTEETNLDFCMDEYAKNVVEKMQPPSCLIEPLRGVKLMHSTSPVLPEKRVRLVHGKSACRLALNVHEEAILYHTGENSVVCLAGDLGMLRFEADFAPAIATMITVYPKFIKVSEIPFPTFEGDDVAENQELFCESLRDAGILEEEVRRAVEN